MRWLDRYEFFDNDLRLWAIALGIVLGVLLLLWAVRALVKRRLANAKQTETDVDDFVYNLAHRTKLYLLAIPAFFFAARTLDLPPDARAAIRTAAVITFLFQAGLWANEVVNFWLRRYKRARVEEDPGAVTTVRAFGFAIKAFLWVVLFLVAVENLGFDVTTLVAGLGIGGVAIALATQNILGDLFASLSIVLDKPFVVGDFIINDTYAGTVQHIGLKTTRVRSISGEEIIFSNADLLKSRVRNMKRMTERRALFTVGVTYDTPVDKLERIPTLVRGMIEKHEDARFDRAHFKAFGESSLDFEIVYFVLSPEYIDYANLQQAINLDLVRTFEAEGIRFAYPTRTVHVVK